LLDFGNETLRALVNEALAANPDLKAAAARVEQARQDVRVATADLLPTLDGSGNGSRAQRPGDQRFPGLGQRANRFNLSLDVAWEPDFWGRIRDERRAAVASFEAGTADYHAARLSLAANTVKAAFAAAEAEAQVALATENVETRRLQQGLGRVAGAVSGGACGGVEGAPCAEAECAGGIAGGIAVEAAGCVGGGTAFV
jgi:outer membrane protein TolC